MSDLIRREDVEKAIQGLHVGDVRFFEKLRKNIDAIPSAEPELEEFEWCHDCKEYDQEKHCCHRWTKVIRQTVEEMKTNWNWTPVTEALPEDRQKVLCVNKHGEMMVGGYMTDYGMTFPCYFEKPVAWMPLPEPWRGDQ